MERTMRESMRELMTMAWRMVRECGMTMGRAMRKAWLVLKLRMAMRQHSVSFEYMKKDGTMRVAYGTLSPASVPALKGTGRSSGSVQVYYDHDKAEWRSFRLENLCRILYVTGNALLCPTTRLVL